MPESFVSMRAYLKALYKYYLPFLSLQELLVRVALFAHSCELQHSAEQFR